MPEILNIYNISNIYGRYTRMETTNKFKKAK